MKTANTGFKPANYTTPKKKPAKRKPSFEQRNPVLSKLLDLKYRINDAYRSGNFDDAYNDTLADKGYVMNLIDGVRKFNWSKLCKEDMLKCNSIWRKYD